MKANRTLQGSNERCAIMTTKFYVTLSKLTTIILLLCEVQYLNENEFEKLRFRISKVTKANVLKELKDSFRTYGNEWTNKDYTENAYIVEKYTDAYDPDLKWREIETWARLRALELFPEFKQ